MIGLALWLAAIALPFIIWLLFRGPGYKRQPLEAPPGPEWVFTGERFVDPTFGVSVDVWRNPEGGERAYVRTRLNDH